ncbi:putative CHY-type Zn-finger protein [Clostridium acetobutylicum]|uniref:Uncharacterized protein n=1 Tax=Clostridium acetobutylicum (strain ATCC 824 / DSM 792 / JCM 1419 / IAM 19013 / LMG 5710 / NBRC 13948 / NRRL B-527 / VKM B-1787 / 2291 / W) TaxID=272562 RepID=Q97HT5_CLOAB|nr:MULTISPECIES: hypothetical protein [Clostridium]AAK79885.1 Hypothetical protein CA_C1922 [Clostridium acetobutylicum ATCC 824]ADZ20974.1 Conserved hypothetical protein [Clostridium acetobutylicum EA 2018]AEI32061.1 hypothetical protein SMB_G1950 [Clostridium acetobutylicum DSM 1731]AWV79684.1 hypothetical protein DK921_06135 [Clostridium acetobutylicum]MBC2394340.1 hypothetical protein [Clostridium acetobutylicum]
MKFYWAAYEQTTEFGTIKCHDVFKEHPFKAIKRKNRNEEGYFTLLNYKEVTKYEYEMFNLELENE